jgi:uncharacterized protein (TIGR03437 family)
MYASFRELLLSKWLSNSKTGGVGRKTYVAGLLIFCACAVWLAPKRDAAAQGGCSVGCTATVPATAQIGAQVSFGATATVSGCASAPVYEWDFGDGSSTSLQQNATHTYSSPGVYTWKLTTTSDAGATTIDTIAGGYGENVSARQAPFTTPTSVARDPLGRGVYVVDEVGGSLIRFINTSLAPVMIAGRSVAPGAVRMIAGGGLNEPGEDTPALQAAIRAVGLGVSANGALLFFNEDGAGRIRVINVSSNTVTIPNTNKSIGVGNTRAFTQFGDSDPLFSGSITGFAIHPTTGDLYFTDSSASVNKVFKVSADGATVTPVAGNGASTMAKDPLPSPPVNATSVPLLLPLDIAFDNAGNLYIADTGHARVVKVDSAGKITLALQYNIQSGPSPYPAALTAIGGAVYLANGNQQTIVNVSGGGAIVAGKQNTACNYIATTCGDGGVGTNATFGLAGSSASPPLIGMKSDATGLYILDQGTNQKGRVRYLNLSGLPVTLAGVTIAPNTIDTIAGSGLASPYDGGPATGSALSFPVGVAIDANANLFIADTLAGGLRFVNRGSNVVTLFPNTPAQQLVSPGAIVTVNKDVNVGQTDGVPVNQASFDTPQGLFITNQGVYVADSKGGLSPENTRNGSIRFINTSPTTVVLFPNAVAPISIPPGYIKRIAGGISSTAIGNGGFALDARLFAPTDIAVNSTTGDIYIADTGNKMVRKINGATGVISSLNLPASQYTGLGLDASGRMYIADFDQNQALRETSAGSGQFAKLNSTALNKPRDIAVDLGGAAYVTNSGDHRILRINSSGAVSPFAGTTAGFDGDGLAATAAKLNISPSSIRYNVLPPAVEIPPTVNIAVSPNGDVIFTDTVNSRVRRIGSGSVTCVKTGTITITGANPSPTLSQITPAFAPVGGAQFTLGVTGTGFVTGSKVRWNGQERSTTYVSSTQLLAQIPAMDIAGAGSASVTVFNPTPGGGVSNSLPIVVGNLNPQPSLSALIPGEAAVGTGFTLTLNGSGFTGTSVVRWNGNARTTTFISENQLQAAIPATDAQSVGMADVSVFNPEPGGGVSNLLSFKINGANPVPTLASITPQAVNAGGPEFMIEVRGTNFAATSKVRWNGADRQTSYQSSILLIAQIPATDIANAGTANVTVFTPTPGGGVSNAATATITAVTNPVPVLTGVTPNSITAGAATFTLVASGSNFTNSSKARWNGQDLQTTFGGSGQVAAQVPANLVASAGSAQVTVFTPAPGGGTSAAQTFTINAIQNNPTPSITTLNPAIVPAGSPMFTLTVTGTNFISGTTVRVNGNNRATTVVSSTQLNATIPAGDVANVGDLAITVFNPTPGGGLSAPMMLKIAPKVTSVSAASYAGAQIAPESIVAAFGTGMATGAQVAPSVPLPTSLLGTTVKVIDSAGTTRPAALFFVSPLQINFQTPKDTVDGLATVVVAVNDNIVGIGTMNITRVAPALFSANSDGVGIASALVLRVILPSGAQSFEPVARFDAGQGKFVPIPIDLGPETQIVYGILYGVGLRGRLNPPNIIVKFSDIIMKPLNPVESEDAFPAPGFIGLDQVNVKFPRVLVGKGLVNVSLIVDGKTSNTIQLLFK